VKNYNGLKMTKIVISILFLLNLNLFADLVDDGLKEYKKGNAKEAGKLYKKACKDGNMKGCIKLGVLYFTGDGVEENHKKAKKLFIKGCKKHYALACYHLGTIYKRGGTGIKRNYRKSRMFYAFGCKIGLAKSCEQYNLIREKREIIGSDSNDHNFSYTYTTEIYGG
jgi:TPR repeat protein